MLDYLNQLRGSLLDPRRFFKNIDKRSFNDGIRFLVMTLVISQIISYLVLSITAHKLLVPFTAINQFLFSLPIEIVSLAALIGLLHLIAKLLGTRASLVQTATAVIFTNGTVIAESIPYFSIVARLYQLVLLVIAFGYLHRYGYTKALVNVVLPALALILLSLLLVPISR